MRSRKTATTVVLLLVALTVRPGAADQASPDLERRFTDSVRPFLESNCISCHGPEKPKGQLDLSSYKTLASVVFDHTRWAVVLEKLAAKEMPPASAKQQPTADARQQVIAWIDAVRKNEAQKNAADPGVVLARRLSNAEYNYTIRDLTGVDLRPAREFPVDPANPAGFDNSGESLAMSPALMTKYLQAAREVANHLVLKPNGLAFAPHPMLVETDRDKYCVQQIMDFYQRQTTDYSAYFQAAWRFKHRAALGQPQASLARLAAEANISPKYLATVWSTLEEMREDVGPTAKLQAMWRELPTPNANQPELARAGSDRMRDFVVRLRKKLEPRFPDFSVKGIAANSQPFLMWKNRQYATHRRTFDRDVLQVEGEAKSEPKAMKGKADKAVASRRGDPDLLVPAGERERYEAAFARFCAVFPDAFYVSERGRNYLDTTKDRGRFLSAGFHNLMGYFRDDQPLYELILDEHGQKGLDALWQDLDFVALGCHRTFVQFVLNEAREAREAAKGPDALDGPVPKDKEITSEAMLQRVTASYQDRARASGNAVAIQAVDDHFDAVNATLRSVEKARVEAEPRHLEAVQEFAARAYRRPLSPAERADLLAYYRSLREKSGLDHAEAVRDLVVSVLMSPDFCYRIDLVGEGPGVRPLSDSALASRLSFFLWSSMPDAELLTRAAAGDLHRPEVLAAQARRMLQDPRVRGLATEFGGGWLDFRRFEEHNAVDRERFGSFTNDLRQAMFEEPVRFLLAVVRDNCSILDFLYANHTFVNPVLARHYGMPDVPGGPHDWVRVDDADKYGRGGLLPMAVFLTKNAPGLRTSPVKRGYWVVKNVLGEVIPPPPAMVPELPRDEATLDLPLRDLLARHREDASCAGCHARFDSLGLVFEGYGPVGERRDKDLAGRAVDPRATFPGGGEGSGLDGLRKYVRERRQDDFVDSLCRKLLAYGLGRSLMLSDDVTVADLRARLITKGYRFDSIIDGIVTSPQFLTKRGRDDLERK